jgi:hypothetical protein
MMDTFEYAHVKRYHEDLVKQAQSARQIKEPHGCKPTLIDMISLLIFNVTVTVGNVISLASEARKTRAMKELTSGCD